MKPTLRSTILVFGCAAGLVAATSQISKAQCCGTYATYYVPYVAWYAPTTACYGGCGSGCSSCGTCGSCGTCSSCSSCSAGCGSSCGGGCSCGSACGSGSGSGCGCASCSTSYYYPAYYWPWFGAKPSTTSRLARLSAPTSRLRLTSSAATRRVAASPKRTSAAPTRLAASPKAPPTPINVVQAAASLPERSEQGPQLLLISQDSSDRTVNASEWKPAVSPEPTRLISPSLTARAATSFASKAAEKNVVRTSGETQMVY
jgi:hypothetical protein